MHWRGRHRQFAGLGTILVSSRSHAQIWQLHLTLSLFICLAVCLSLSISLSDYISVCLSLSLYLILYVSLSHSVSFTLSVSLSLLYYVCLSFTISNDLHDISVRLCLSPCQFCFYSLSFSLKSYIYYPFKLFDHKIVMDVHYIGNIINITDSKPT